MTWRFIIEVINLDDTLIGLHAQTVFNNDINKYVTVIQIGLLLVNFKLILAEREG